MKKTLIILTAVLMITGMTAGVVGHDCPEDADLCIQDNSNNTPDNSTSDEILEDVNPEIGSFFDNLVGSVFEMLPF